MQLWTYIMSWWALRTSNSRWTRHTLKKGPFDLVGITSDKHKLSFILVFFNWPLLRVPQTVLEAPAKIEIFHEEVQTTTVDKSRATVTFIPLVPLCLLLETPSHQVDPGLLSLLVDPEGTTARVSSPCSSRSSLRKGSWMMWRCSGPGLQIKTLTDMNSFNVWSMTFAFPRTANVFICVRGIRAERG